uniref:Uncharacterized LOC100175690 n=1 Tax=Ciona intestinalis TaxID=7719 RepID=A0A1W5B306_CIOIN|nr:uncharacterized protein LOC100175690 [Ciona intestinalis]|eukprot:XP_002127930.1 uncharacterized protein LOC100175690 [Ciona intestinalis]
MFLKKYGLVVCCWLLVINVAADLNIPFGLKQSEYCKLCKVTCDGIGRFKREGNKVSNLDQVCSKKYLLLEGVEMTKARKVCEHILEEYDDEMESKVFTTSDIAFRSWLCNERSYACIGLRKDELDITAKKPIELKADELTEDELVDLLMKDNKGRVMSPRYNNKEEL